MCRLRSSWKMKYQSLVVDMFQCKQQIAGGLEPIVDILLQTATHNPVECW